MSVNNPANIIPRRSIAGEENEYVKMFDPPTETLVTPDRVAPTNPVPSFMAARGLSTPTVPNTLQLRLLRNLGLNSWDLAHTFGMFTVEDIDANVFGFPGPTIRVPRGVIFHCRTVIGSGPHTIHWHGIEPTPMNDGVGHCSAELGGYTYQWQPNFMGTYFYHCHRNTVQHFDFGLYGALLIEPPDAYAQQNPALPNYAGGYPRRIGANVAKFPQFPGFNSNSLLTMDPHAHTIPYDVEALWVLDDIDSRWHALAGGRGQTFPQSGVIPGTNDNFHGDEGGIIPPGGFFAFNDFVPDYFFCTGVPFANDYRTSPGAGRPTGNGGASSTFTPPASIPPALNSGVTGMQVAVNTTINKTILVRCLNAAYCPIKVKFPVDIVIIAWDGRALGVPPFDAYNHAYLVPANTEIFMSTARRFGALIRSATPVNSFATIKFLNHLNENETVFTARIPIVIA